jgi:hypothetical protein
VFENAVLVASLIADKRVREEKLPRLVFDEFDWPPRREPAGPPSRRPRFLHRDLAGSGR